MSKITIPGPESNDGMKSKRPRRKGTTSISTPRWLGYAAAVAATAALGHAETAAAAITVVPENRLFNGIAGSFVMGTFALGSGGAHFKLQFVRSYGRSFPSGPPGYGAAAANVSGGASMRGLHGTNPVNQYVTRLGVGDRIATGGFINGGANIEAFFGNLNSQWGNSGTGYIGFKFTDAGGSETGWAELTVSGEPDNAFTLDEYAFGTAGEQLTAGQIVEAVPEPGSLALLAVGGAGLLAWRQRRATARDADLPA